MGSPIQTVQRAESCLQPSKQPSRLADNRFIHQPYVVGPVTKLHQHCTAPHNRPLVTVQVWADDPAKLKLQRRAHIVWEGGGPRTALLVKKPGTPAATAKLGEVAAVVQCPFYIMLVSMEVSSSVVPC